MQWDRSVPDMFAYHTHATIYFMCMLMKTYIQYRQDNIGL